jgi:hypothetical protein
MSLSLIFWKPFTEDPSNANPVRNVSSSTTGVLVYYFRGNR